VSNENKLLASSCHLFFLKVLKKMFHSVRHLILCFQRKQLFLISWDEQNCFYPVDSSFSVFIYSLRTI